MNVVVDIPVPMALTIAGVVIEGTIPAHYLEDDPWLEAHVTAREGRDVTFTFWLAVEEDGGLRLWSAPKVGQVRGGVVDVAMETVGPVSADIKVRDGGRYLVVVQPGGEVTYEDCYVPAWLTGGVGAGKSGYPQGGDYLTFETDANGLVVSGLALDRKGLTEALARRPDLAAAVRKAAKAMDAAMAAVHSERAAERDGVEPVAEAPASAWGCSTDPLTDAEHEALKALGCELFLESVGDTGPRTWFVWRAHDGAFLGPESLGEVRGYLRWLIRHHIRPEGRGPGQAASVGLGQFAGQAAWFAWSHRDAAAFKVGDKVFTVAELRGRENVPLAEVGTREILTLDDARESACNFAEHVS